VIQTICKLLGDLFWRNVSQHRTSYIPLCICSLLQALHTSCGYLDSFYAHCTHQRTVRTLAFNKLEEWGRKSTWPNNKRYVRMPGWNSEWLIFNMRIEFVDMRIQIRCFWQRLFVIVVWPDNNAVRRKGIFSIHSLDFESIFKIVKKIVISDC